MALRLTQICLIQSWCLFFCFRPKIHFLGKFDSKIQNCFCKLKFGTHTNSNIQNAMVMFTFSIFDRKYSLRANLIQKIKIFSLTWNLLPRVIRICRIQWWCSTTLISTENALFGQIWSKIIKIFCLSSK